MHRPAKRSALPNVKCACAATTVHQFTAQLHPLSSLTALHRSIASTSPPPCSGTGQTVCWSSRAAAARPWWMRWCEGWSGTAAACCCGRTWRRFWWRAGGLQVRRGLYEACMRAAARCACPVMPVLVRIELSCTSWGALLSDTVRVCYAISAYLTPVAPPTPRPGVRLRGGRTIRASHAVVSNASAPDTLRLLPREAVPDSWRASVAATPLNPSFMHLHLGFDATGEWTVLAAALSCLLSFPPAPGRLGGHKAGPQLTVGVLSARAANCFCAFSHATLCQCCRPGGPGAAPHCCERLGARRGCAAERGARLDCFG